MEKHLIATQKCYSFIFIIKEHELSLTYAANQYQLYKLQNKPKRA